MSKQLGRPEEEQQDLPSSFIEPFQQHILRFDPDANELWAKTVSLTSFGLFCTPVHFETTKDVITPNIFALAVGPSKIADKGGPRKFAVKLAHDVTYALYPELRIQTSEGGKSGKKAKKAPRYDDLAFELPNEFSDEMLVSILSKKKVGIILHDEFTGLIKAVLGKSYMVERLEFLSRLADGFAANKATKKSGYEKAEGTSVAFLSATTPYIYRVMKPELFVQGTGQRFLFALIDIPSGKVETNPEEFYGMQEPERQTIERDEVTGEFAKNLAMFYKFLSEKRSIVFPSQEAAAILAAYRDRVKNKARDLARGNIRSLEYSYLDGMVLHVNRLAFILTMDRYFGSVVAGAVKENSLVFKASDTNYRFQFMMTPEIAQSAVEMADVYYCQFQRLLREWKKYGSTEPPPFRTSEELLGRVEAYMDDPLTVKDKDGWTSEKLLLRKVAPSSEVEWKFFKDNYLESQERPAAGGRGGMPSKWVRFSKS